MERLLSNVQKYLTWFRVIILFILLVFSFSLLFLDWYND
jgi:hypothetical protein